MSRRDALALALALALAQPVEAAAHCYSVWKYPHAQRCKVGPPTARTVARASAPGLVIRKREPGPAFTPDTFDLPLPDPDPATTALRAQLWTLP